MSNRIDPTLLYPGNSSMKTADSSSVLGKDAFLKLLLVQLQNQDPLNPIEDREFISQLANFSSLEQMMTMNETLSSLLELQSASQLWQYLGLVGREVTWQKSGTNGDDLMQGTGLISEIRHQDGSILFVLNDGTEIEPDSLKSISSNFSGSAIAQASHLIGKKVGWNTVGGIQYAGVTSVFWKDGKIYLQLDDEKQTQITIDQILSVEKGGN